MDATAKELNLKRSIRKFFIDALGSTENVYFDYLYDTPVDESGNKVTSWMVILLETRNLNTLSNQSLDIHLFTTKDREGDRMSALIDTVYGILEDENMPDNNKRIPLYDTESSPWTLIGGIVPVKIIDGENSPAKDKTKYKLLKVDLRWSAKV